jgi:hypothetical protein
MQVNVRFCDNLNYHELLKEGHRADEKDNELLSFSPN